MWIRPSTESTKGKVKPDWEDSASTSFLCTRTTGYCINTDSTKSFPHRVINVTLPVRLNTLFGCRDIIPETMTNRRAEIACCRDVSRLYRRQRRQHSGISPFQVVVSIWSFHCHYIYQAATCSKDDYYLLTIPSQHGGIRVVRDLLVYFQHFILRRFQTLRAAIIRCTVTLRSPCIESMPLSISRLKYLTDIIIIKCTRCCGVHQYDEDFSWSCSLLSVREKPLNHSKAQWGRNGIIKN